ncbi:MAG: endolytic transglycosylase MltG [Candidatus Sumerlaeota bacterium]
MPDLSETPLASESPHSLEVKTDGDNPEPDKQASLPQNRGCRRLFSCFLQALGLFTLACIVVACLGAGWFWYWAHHDSNHAAGGQTVDLAVKKGDSLLRISQRLESAGLVDRPRLFVLLAILRGDEKDLQAGMFHIEPGSSPAVILDRLLLSGEAPSVVVTFPEGWTTEQMARRLQEAELIDSAETFLKATRDEELLKRLSLSADTVNGYLFPDTYYFSPEADPERVISRMVARFRDITGSGGLDLYEEKAPNGLSFHERVILASIIERESRKPEEMPLIASVYHNRLRRNMRLDSCATVRYALDKWRAPLSRRDLEVESPWNTYRTRSLPPGPICNPGSVALEAAFRPAESDYLFYVYRGEGRHHFSRTLKEHEAAAKKYREFWSFSAGKSSEAEPALAPGQ